MSFNLLQFPGFLYLNTYIDHKEDIQLAALVLYSLHGQYEIPPSTNFLGVTSQYYSSPLEALRIEINTFTQGTFTYIFEGT